MPTEPSKDDFLADGRLQVEDDGFIGHAGPTWLQVGQEGATPGFFAKQRHKNRSGVVQGAMLAT